MEIHYNVQLDREKLATSFKNFNQLEKKPCQNYAFKIYKSQTLGRPVDYWRSE